MTATRVINAFSVLVLLTSWLCGQNPDELLVVRLPAKYGHINEPGVAPIPFSTVRGELAGSRKDRKCGSTAASRISAKCCDCGSNQVAGEGKLSRHCAGKEDKDEDMACARAEMFVGSLFWEPTLVLPSSGPRTESC
jgi:hypothetical protein